MRIFHYEICYTFNKNLLYFNSYSQNYQCKRQVNCVLSKVLLQDNNQWCNEFLDARAVRKSLHNDSIRTEKFLQVTDKRSLGAAPHGSHYPAARPRRLRKLGNSRAPFILFISLSTSLLCHNRGSIICLNFYYLSFKRRWPRPLDLILLRTHHQVTGDRCRGLHTFTPMNCSIIKLPGAMCCSFAGYSVN